MAVDSVIEISSEEVDTVEYQLTPNKRPASPQSDSRE